MICPYCGKPARWVDNEVIYGKRYGKSYKAWFCAPCDAFVGCHNNTKAPLGTMANRELRRWRIKAHDAIDTIWKFAPSPLRRALRAKTYARLRDLFGRDVHIGESGIDGCKAIIAAAPKMKDLVDADRATRRRPTRSKKRRK